MTLCTRIHKRMVLLSLVACFALSACSSHSIPADTSNICSIFQEKDDWYAAAHEVHEHYGVPIHVAMAIMYQETKFRDFEETNSDWFLVREQRRNIQKGGFILVPEAVWKQYREEEGSVFTSRHSFQDSLGFVAWYMKTIAAKEHIALTDASRQYLIYHEGLKDYQLGTYRSKAWLLKAAQDVALQAENYRKQLLHCQIY